MVGQSKKRKQENALQGEFEFHQPTRRGRGGGKKEGTLGKPTVNEVELDMYGAEESDEENFDHEGRENDYRLEARHHSRKSASPPSAKQYGTPTAITANGKPHGLAMASQMEEQFVFYKRAICDANILGYHQDSQFYATGDKMVCQFVETACGAEKWNPESSLEPDKVREAKKHIGEPNFIRYRKMCSEAIGSRRAELTSGDRGLKKTAAKLWDLEKIRRERGADAENEEKLRLLADETYHYGPHRTPLADPTFMKVIETVFKTLELSPALLSWSMVVLEEYFKGHRMANDDVSSKQKMVEKGDLLLKKLQHLKGKQLNVPKVEVSFRDNVKVSAAVRIRKQAEAARRRQRRHVDLASLDWVPADFAPAQQKDDNEEDAASSPGVDVPTKHSTPPLDGDDAPVRLRKRLCKVFEKSSDDEPSADGQPDARGSGLTRSAGAGVQAKSEVPRPTSPPTSDEQTSPARAPEKLAANGKEPSGAMSQKTPGASVSILGPASAVEEEKQLLLAAINGEGKSLAVAIGKEDITNAMIVTLLGTNFVGQEIINGYAELLKSREFTARTVEEIELPHCVFLSSYFYTKYVNEGKQYESLARWVKELDPLIDYDQVFMPLNWVDEVHWTLAVAYPLERKIVYYDPYLEPDQDPSTAAMEALADLDFVAKATRPNFNHRSKTLSGHVRGALPGANSWKLEVYDEEDFPRQTDGNSCGIFLLKFMEHMSRDGNLEGLDEVISQDHMKRYRRAIAIELLHKRVKLPLSKEGEDDGNILAQNGQLSQTM